ncbi:hypothetical protein JCM30394_23330 [Deferrisoma palaeochoriense]
MGAQMGLQRVHGNSPGLAGPSGMKLRPEESPERREAVAMVPKSVRPDASSGPPRPPPHPGNFPGEAPLRPADFFSVTGSE